MTYVYIETYYVYVRVNAIVKHYYSSLEHNTKMGTYFSSGNTKDTALQVFILCFKTKDKLNFGKNCKKKHTMQSQDRLNAFKSKKNHLIVFFLHQHLVTNNLIFGTKKSKSYTSVNGNSLIC